MNKTNWKIAEQSKQKMVQALLNIMKQYDYKEITVTQITQEAQLSRKTFYRLFSDKDDILLLFFDGLFQECFAQIKEQKIQRYWDVVQVFEFVRSKERADFFAVPLPYMLAYSVGGMHSMLLKWVEKGMDIPSAELISKLKSGFMSEDI